MPLFAVDRYADAGRLRELLLGDTSRPEAAHSGSSASALRKLRKVYKYNLHTHKRRGDGVLVG